MSLMTACNVTNLRQYLGKHIMVPAGTDLSRSCQLGDLVSPLRLDNRAVLDWSFAARPTRMEGSGDFI